MYSKLIFFFSFYCILLLTRFFFFFFFLKVDGDNFFPLSSEEQSSLKQNLAHKRSITTTEHEETKRARLLDMACLRLQSLKSDSQIIACGWGIELDKMTPNQQLYAKKFIDEILFEGRLGNLHRYSVTINHSPSSFSPNLNG